MRSNLVRSLLLVAVLVFGAGLAQALPAAVSVVEEQEVVVTVAHGGYIEAVWNYCPWPFYDWCKTVYRDTDPKWENSHPHGIPIFSRESRSFITFDVGGAVPAGATVTGVDFYYAHSVSYSSGPGTPASWAMKVYSSSQDYEYLTKYDWEDGSYLFNYPWFGSPQDAWIDLGTRVVTWFNNSDPTTFSVIIRDRSAAADRGHWGAIIATEGRVPNICKLRITYVDDGGPADPYISLSDERESWGTVKSLYR
ncbi:hypothetical protein H8E07_15815 [bacterium]|nr:hypothetical protein [bacterium]